MNFFTAVHTDIGIKKSTNQDSALVMEAKTDIGNVLLTVICDGMGGLAKGEVASSAVIQEYSQWFEQQLPTILSIEDPTDRIFSSWEKIVFACNEKISQYGKRNGVSMGTTLVAMLFVKERYYIINVGDSRVYSLSDQLYLLRKDQTFVQREMDMGRMTYEEAMNSPQRNVLLQCIGASNFIDPDYYTGDVLPNQSFMLCSDGFRHLISDAELYDNMNPYLLTDEQIMLDKCVYLTELNKSRMERDNITVALIKAY